ncbi:Peptidase family A1 domain [Trinorchestia longiramus]|nr:Peptidase family A1 domain [Trinorchestia longiramus]
MLAQPLSSLLFLHVSVVLILNNGLGGFSFSANNFHQIEDTNFSANHHVEDANFNGNPPIENANFNGNPPIENANLNGNHHIQDANSDGKTSPFMRDVKIHTGGNSKPPSQWNLFGIPGDGYYITAQIGTPPQKVNLLVDTGSSNLAVAGTSSGELDTFFDASQSSSFIPLTNSHLKVSYSQGWWQGSLGTDIVAVPGVTHSLSTRSFVALITDSHGFYVNGSHWQGILGLAFPELAQPNRTIQPWFDSVISARNSVTFQREEMAVSSVNEDFTNVEHGASNGSAQTFLGNDGLDLDEFIDKSRKRSELKFERENELKSPQDYSLKDGKVVERFDFRDAPKTDGTTEVEDGVSGPADERKSAKDLDSSAIVQVTDSLTTNSSEVTDSLTTDSSEVIGSGDGREAVIQEVRLSLASKFSGIPINQLKAKNSAKEFVKSTQDEQVVSVIRVPVTPTGYESNFIDYTTSNITEISFLSNKNMSKISNEVTVNSVTELDPVSTIPLAQFYSTDEYFESQQESSSGKDLGKLNILKTHRTQFKMKAQFSNESAVSEVNQTLMDDSDLFFDTDFRNSSFHLSDFANVGIPESIFPNSATDSSEEDSKSIRKNLFHVEEGSNDELFQRASSLVNSSASVESFTLELCGPWSSAPFFDAHEGRFSIGTDGGCGQPAYETPIVAPWFYEIAVTGVSVGSTRLPLPCAVYNHHASIVDSGTTKLKLPQAALDAVVQALEEESSQLVDVPLPPHFWRGTGHVCWPSAHPAWSRLPLLSIDIALSNSSSFSIELGPQSYLRPVLSVASLEPTSESVPAENSNMSVSVSTEESGFAISGGDSKFSETPHQSNTSISAHSFNSSLVSEDSNVSETDTSDTKLAAHEDASTSAHNAEKHETLSRLSLLSSSVLTGSSKSNYANYSRPKRNTGNFLSHRYEGNHVSFSIGLHVNLNHPSDRISGSYLKEKATKEKIHDPPIVNTNQGPSLTQSNLQDNFVTSASLSQVVPCWSSGIELSDMGTVLGAVVLEGLCVHFDRSRGVVGFSESSCGPRVRLSGPHLRGEAEVCAAPHRDVLESGAGEAGTVVLAAILVLLCCPFALFVVRALWRLARHHFFSMQQAETTFLSLDESTSVA